MYYIFHHDDPDGHIAGAIIYRRLVGYYDVSPENITCIPADYNSTFLHMIDFKQEINDIYFVDLSFTESSFEKLAEVCRAAMHSTVHWFDHHDSSRSVLPKALEYGVDVRFSTGMCGAAHAYIHTGNIEPVYGEFDCKVYPLHDENGESNIVYVVEINGTKIEIPEFIYHIDQYDRWTREDPNADAFVCGLKGLPYGYYLSADNIQNPDGLYHDMQIAYSKVRDIIDKGKIALNYHMSIMEEQSDNIGYWQIGKTRIAYKNGIGNSWNFCKILENNEADIGFIGHYVPDANKWVYSMYANKDQTIEVNKICEQFSGGGHPGAAGFSSELCFFGDHGFDSEWFKSTYYNVYEALRRQRFGNLNVKTPSSSTNVVDPIVGIFLGGNSDNSWRNVLKQYLRDDFYYDPYDNDADHIKTDSDFKYKLFVLTPVDDVNNYTELLIEIMAACHEDPNHSTVYFCGGKDDWKGKFDNITRIVNTFINNTDAKVCQTSNMSDLIFKLGQYIADVVKDMSRNN